MYFIYYNFDKWIYILLNLLIFYALLRLVYKSKANIIDVFYIMDLFLMYEILNVSISNLIVNAIVIMAFSILCKIYEKKLRKINYRVMNIWNEESENSLRLRCVFVILFNMSFYIIFNIVNL